MSPTNLRGKYRLRMRTATSVVMVVTVREAAAPQIHNSATWPYDPPTSVLLHVVHRIYFSLSYEIRYRRAGGMAARYAVTAPRHQQTVLRLYRNALYKEHAFCLSDKRLSYFRFEYRPQHRLIWLKFSVVSLPTSGQCLYSPLIGHGHFIPHPFPMTAVCTSMISRKYHYLKLKIG
jgi:hypothetical protein